MLKNNVIELDIPFDDLDDCVYTEICEYMNSEKRYVDKFGVFGYNSMFTLSITYFCILFLSLNFGYRIEFPIVLLSIWFLYNFSNFHNAFKASKNYKKFIGMTKEDYFKLVKFKFNSCEDKFSSDDIDVNIGKVLVCWDNIKKIKEQYISEYCVLSDRFLLLKCVDRFGKESFFSFIIELKKSSECLRVPVLCYDSDSGSLILRYNKNSDLIKSELV